jgi:EAL domain-containing protein (putative c-di-GMP-specific phosphodiesterase class I)
VLGNALYALREAKNGGRAKYKLFDPDLVLLLDARNDLRDSLDKALLDSMQFYIEYQPKVDFDGRVVGAEALLRWEHPVKGFIPAVDFIALAEETGLINEIGYWVTKSVLNQLYSWTNEGVEFPNISINLSAIQLVDDKYVDYLLDRLLEFDLSPSCIEFELTETDLLINKSKAFENMRKLQKSGISLALDNFGTGYSSLTYLKLLPLDVLKIDKSFVGNVFDTKEQEIVRSIISISRALSLRTVAEGVESEEQMKVLARMGCDYFQGFYFSKPLISDDLISFLQGRGASVVVKNTWRDRLL